MIGILQRLNLDDGAMRVEFSTTASWSLVTAGTWKKSSTGSMA